MAHIFLLSTFALMMLACNAYTALWAAHTPKCNLATRVSFLEFKMFQYCWAGGWYHSLACSTEFTHCTLTLHLRNAPYMCTSLACHSAACISDASSNAGHLSNRLNQSGRPLPTLATEPCRQRLTGQSWRLRQGALRIIILTTCSPSTGPAGGQALQSAGALSGVPPRPGAPL